MSDLSQLHSMRINVQRMRIQTGNRLHHYETGKASTYSALEDILDDLYSYLEGVEARIDGAIKNELSDFPVWDHWLSHVKGIGPSFAGALLAMLIPPQPERSPSIWYKAAGLNPVPKRDMEGKPTGDSTLPKPTRPRCPECDSTKIRSNKEGENRICRDCGAVMPSGFGRISYHPALRQTLHNIGKSFVVSGGFYREQYLRFKGELAEKHDGDPKWPKLRVDRVARWKAVKLFLSHLWNKWAEAEGITVRPPYPFEHLDGHTHYIAPPEPGAKKF